MDSILEAEVEHSSAMGVVIRDTEFLAPQVGKPFQVVRHRSARLEDIHMLSQAQAPRLDCWDLQAASSILFQASLEGRLLSVRMKSAKN